MTLGEPGQDLGSDSSRRSHEEGAHLPLCAWLNVMAYSLDLSASSLGQHGGRLALREREEFVGQLDCATHQAVGPGRPIRSRRLGGSVRSRAYLTLPVTDGAAGRPDGAVPRALHGCGARLCPGAAQGLRPRRPGLMLACVTITSCRHSRLGRCGTIGLRSPGQQVHSTSSGRAPVARTASPVGACPEFRCASRCQNTGRACRSEPVARTASRYDRW